VDIGYASNTTFLDGGNFTPGEYQNNYEQTPNQIFFSHPNRDGHWRERGAECASAHEHAYHAGAPWWAIGIQTLKPGVHCTAYRATGTPRTGELVMIKTVVISGISLCIGLILGGAAGIRAGYMRGLDDVEQMIGELQKR